MEGNEKERVFSVPVKAGKRTYFFDVKRTKNGKLYLNISESKKIFDNRQGRFIFEKHTIFLFQEDFEKFMDGFQAVMQCVETGIIPEIEINETKNIDEISEIEKEFDRLD